MAPSTASGFRAPEVDALRDQPDRGDLEVHPVRHHVQDALQVGPRKATATMSRILRIQEDSGVEMLAGADAGVGPVEPGRQLAIRWANPGIGTSEHLNTAIFLNAKNFLTWWRSLTGANLRASWT